LCKKRRLLTVKVPGFNWERLCKLAYESITRLSVKQGEQAWWEEVKLDSRLLSLTITEYTNKTGASVGRGKKRGAGFSVAQLRERLIASSGVEHRNHGIMMWKEQYVIFAGSVEGGFKTRTEAEVQWNIWAQQVAKKLPEAPPHDYQSPHATEKLRMNVITETSVDDFNKFEGQKELEVELKKNKKATEDDLAKMRASIFEKQDSIAGSTNMDFSSVQRSLVSAGADSSGGTIASAFTS